MNKLFIFIDLFQQSKSGKVAFVKIHASWDILAKGAELANMKMPLAVRQST